MDRNHWDLRFERIDPSALSLSLALLGVLDEILHLWLVYDAAACSSYHAARSPSARRRAKA
jgi:hypothetical protein